MTTVAELIPGNIIDVGDKRGTFIAHTKHPIWPSLQLVIWKMSDDTWSFDALSLNQDVGHLSPTSNKPKHNQARLRRALLPNEVA